MIICSKEGEIGVWDPQLRLDKVYSMTNKPKKDDEAEAKSGDAVKKR